MAPWSHDPEAPRCAGGFRRLGGFRRCDRQEAQVAVRLVPGLGARTKPRGPPQVGDPAAHEDRRLIHRAPAASSAAIAATESPAGRWVGTTSRAMAAVCANAAYRSDFSSA